MNLSALPLRRPSDVKLPNFMRDNARKRLRENETKSVLMLSSIECNKLSLTAKRRLRDSFSRNSSWKKKNSARYKRARSKIEKDSECLTKKERLRKESIGYGRKRNSRSKKYNDPNKRL